MGGGGGGGGGCGGEEGVRLTKILAHYNFTCFVSFTTDVIRGMISCLGMITFFHSKYISYPLSASCAVNQLAAAGKRLSHKNYASFRLSWQILFQTCDIDIFPGFQVCELTWFVNILQ